MSTFDDVRRVVMNEMGVELDTITKGARLVEDLNMDSLDLVELVMAIEEEFSIEIRDEDAEQVRTVGDLVALVRRLDRP